MKTEIQLHFIFFATEEIILSSLQDQMTLSSIEFQAIAAQYLGF